MNFNKKNVVDNSAVSYEGGDVYKKDVLQDWLNFMFTSLLENRFYESAEKQNTRFLELTEQVAANYGVEFVAKASIYARNELGLRSISQLAAAWLNDKYFDGKRGFYRTFCHRADDPANLFAAVGSLGQKRSHALVRGCGDYLSTIDAYQIDKYRMNDKMFDMFDCINITHANSDVINAFKHGEIESANTWENNVAIAAKTGGVEAKNRAITELVESGDMGYMVLLKNLRSIINTNPSREWINDVLCPKIRNKTAIKRSLVFPYRIYSAYKALVDSGISNPAIVSALDDAFITAAVENVPALPGVNVIALDVSGSMCDTINKNSSITMCECGAVYAAAIAISNEANKDCDTYIVKFGTSAMMYTPKRSAKSGVMAYIANLVKNDGCGYGTDVSGVYSVLDSMNINCDRLFLVSDFQIMNGSHWQLTAATPSGSSYARHDTSAVASYKEYAKKFSNPHRFVYSFDISNYSTQIVNPNIPGVFLLSSLSDKIFDFVGVVEEDPQAVVKKINEIRF